MSITPSILVLLLCLSFHACTARKLGVINKKPENKFWLPNKNGEKVGLIQIPAPLMNKLSLSTRLQVAKNDSKLKESRVDNHIDNPATPKANPKDLKDPRVKILDAAQTESLATVSWRVPHRKRREKQPGFNLDYSPPKTHPPVHN
ncbi:unnamed protein product [Ilex paraguariensis]|uniref:Uncharacterized protein n=1 Tax=Ilex paraguariensis TaxID=185542 RepID=A0ABC8SQD9_9AQUA